MGASSWRPDKPPASVCWRMRLLLLTLHILALNIFVKTADDLVICVPRSTSTGPSNSRGIPPIFCRKVVDNSIIECYPNKVIVFPLPCPGFRIACFPIQPSTTTILTTSAAVAETSSSAESTSTTVADGTTKLMSVTTVTAGTMTLTSVTTSTLKTSRQPTTTKTTVTSTETTTTEAFIEEIKQVSLKNVRCLPISACDGCGQNSLQIDAIICQMPDNYTQIRCFPNIINFAFGQTEQIGCSDGEPI